MDYENDPKIDIAESIRKVRDRINAACERAGRKPEEVTLIAVSKTKPFADITRACETGVLDFGENYVQELTQKLELNDNSCERMPIRWHMIGHLQKNKVKYLIGKTALIHSVDTTSLAEKLETEAAKRDCTLKILLEVNVAGEETKWGFSPDCLLKAARDISVFPHIRVLGLMTSAPATCEPETNREYFRNLNSLAHKLAESGLLALNDPDFHSPVLSMGMTNDFEIAIEEGATMVRLGTAIFGKRNYT
ncbi:MAG: YggS family pyridoxal phosphate-dependent enzyme [Clostridia bacterium]|nr:YggS family pyridoxal phosphate-dependent enzyme [Clostridia bacterium]